MTHYRFASHIARFDLLDDGAHAHIVDLVALQPRLVHDAANRLAHQQARDLGAATDDPMDETCIQM